MAEISATWKNLLAVFCIYSHRFYWIFMPDPYSGISFLSADSAAFIVPQSAFYPATLLSIDSSRLQFQAAGAACGVEKDASKGLICLAHRGSGQTRH
jgi:hypothetical protein